MKPGWSASRRVNLLYVSTSLLWWQAVAGRIGVQSSHAWRSNARRRGDTERARSAATTPPSTVRSARCPMRSVTVGVHGCPHGVAPLRHHTASRDTPGPHTGGETTQSLYMPGDAVPARLSSFRLLAMVSPQLDTRRKLLI
jgi:hypothetical protein